MEIITIELVHWLCKKNVHIEQTTIKYFKTIYPNKNESKTILYFMEKSKKVISSSCQIVDTFFTKKSLIWKVKQKWWKWISTHVDKEDLVTA